jgi:crotonobetaine/carnitine-CoA ligase
MGVLCRHPDPARPWAECRIVDDLGAEVAPGEVGELAVRTPILMKGYFGDEEQTRKSFFGDWFLTGDLARVDAQGHYFFVSRKKDIIRRRGENIAGSELDRVVAEHPQVMVAAAIGVPSELGDEDILMAVKPRDGAPLTERDVVEWCRQRLAAMKVPRYVVLLDEMPLTSTHKVAKAALRADLALRRRAVDFNA